MNLKPFYMIILGCLFLLGSIDRVDAEMFIYPKEGQSRERQDRDEFECYKWARERTGTNPMETAQAPAPPPESPSSVHDGSVLRSGARGAALGALGGAIAGDAGQGAKIGAAVGGAAGLMKRRRNRVSQQQNQQRSQQQAAQQNQSKRANYDKAYKVCLKGRGYEVE